MKIQTKTKIRFSVSVAWLFLFLCGTANASEFLQLCQNFLPKTESLLSECKKNARPFKRNFYPGGSGSPVQENFRVWFDTENAGSHFGTGCVVLGEDHVRFLGLYFFLDSKAFRSGNSADFKFVDFQGNVGILLPNGSVRTMLAVHKLFPDKGDIVTDGQNCRIGKFDRASNLTVNKTRNNLWEFWKIGSDQPAEIIKCIDKEIRYTPSQCFKRSYRSFLNAAISPVIYWETFIVITEEGRVYASEDLLERACKPGWRPNLEFVGVIKELCS
jgi:hypothetical protein